MKEFQLSEVKLHNKITSCWIVINYRVYDITEYLDEHPGGQHILLKYAGKDATEAFKKVGHTSKAYQEMNKYVIGRVAGTQVELINNLKKKNRSLKNLITHEDIVIRVPHVHKILGLVCLFHYFYRFGYCTVMQMKGNSDAWNAGFDKSYKSLILVWIHALLSYSSLIFHIPKKQTGKPMIWQEFRAHNIAFASRSILCFTINWIALRNKKVKQFQNVLLSIIVLTTFMTADIITAKLREANTESTTQTLPYWDDCPHGVEKSFKYYYMLAQYQASIACLNTDILFPAFSVMFPIQFASLLMTLVRKGIIDTKQYHLTYLISLILPYLIFFNQGIALYAKLGIFLLGLSIILVSLRRNLRLNKYSIWMPILIFYSGFSFRKLDIYSFPRHLGISTLVLTISLIVFKRSKSRNLYFLNHKNQKKKVRLIEKKKLTHDTYELTFKIPENKKFGLRTGEHITIYSKNPNKLHNLWNKTKDFETNKIIKRKYTPTEIQKGSFKLAIKEYKGSERYPDGGKMSQILAKLKVNDNIIISGPNGHNTYLGHGRMMVHNKIIEVKHVYMICAGTGLTPMYHILTTILESPQDKTTITMLYVNKTRKDIMLNNELLLLQKKYSEQYQLYNCLTRDANSKADFNHRPDKTILEKIISNNNSIIMLCGPKSFVNSMYSTLTSLHIDSNYIIVF